MRVALATLYPRDAQRIAGGIRMVSHNLVQGLLAFPDLELHVVHCHTDIHDELVEVHGRLIVHYLPTPALRLVPNLVTSYQRVKALLDDLQPDLVHAHVAHLAYAGVRSGLPTVFTVHGVLAREREVYSETLYDRLRYGLLSWFEARALPRVDAAVAISPHVLDAYCGQGDPRWVRIDNPVPERYWELADSSITGRILYAGSITEIKDLLTLLRAVRRVRDALPEAHLRIAGRVTSETYNRRVRDGIVELGLEDAVTFLGLLDPEVLDREYASSSVVALSSLQENAPMTLIEAMAAAKPVVATRVGGIPDLVEDGETGYLVPAQDAEAMAERLLELLRDPALGRQMGARGREIASQRFALGQVARAYYDLYQRVSHADRGGA